MQAFHGMMPYKRPAADKSGVPVYQPNATTYQQLMQLQQPFVPVSCEYSVSPAPVPANSSATPPVDDTQTLVPATPQLPQISKENEINPAAIPVTSAAMSALPPPQIPDPAALAKEVAQQNYAKAVKLAAVNQSFASNQLSHLNPLNYTGVALNKQAMTMPPPSLARYPQTLPIGFSAAGLGLGINPYAAAGMPQTNLLNISRPPPTFMNPYSLVRNPYATAATQQIISPQFISAQYPVSVAATSITNVPTTTNIAVAQNNNNNVVVPPYKKLKTT